MHIAHGMEELSHLALPGTDHPRVGMSRRCDTECSRKIEITLAIGIPDNNALCPLPNDGPGTV